MPINYYYITNRINSKSINSTGIPSSGDISFLTDNENPVYNFSSDFITSLLTIKNSDISLSQPYVSLCSLDEDGNIAHDFNKEFFTKPVNTDLLANSARFSDRPMLSFEKLKVSTDLAAGGGFVSWTNVNLTLKIHKPSVLINDSLNSLCLRGTSMRLEYGWNSSVSSILNKKNVLFFKVAQYTIAFDNEGQAEFTLTGYAQSENFANLFIGDDGTRATSENSSVSSGQADNIDTKSNNVKRINAVLVTTKATVTTPSTRRVSVYDSQTQTYTSMAMRPTENTKSNYQKSMKLLASKKKSNQKWFNDIEKNQKTGKEKGSYVILHDVISILCGDTLNALLSAKVMPDKNFRVVYGSFNENLGSFANKSVADFPIHWNTFLSMMNESASNSNSIPTVQNVLNILGQNFLNNELYWRSTIVQNEQKLDLPHASIMVSSHFNQNNEIIQISIFDVNLNIPVTQQKLSTNFQEAVTLAAQQKVSTDNTNIPTVRIGHANSFIKSITMQHIDDEYIKTVYIVRSLDESVSSPKQSLVPGAIATPQPDVRLFIPLRGEMELLGHIEWQPARFFYLSSGIFFIDGFYGITSVEHDFSSQGFTTHVKFIMH